MREQTAGEMGVVVDDEKVVDPSEDVIQPELQRRQFP